MSDLVLEQNLVQRANVADVLRRSAAQYKGKTAIVDSTESVSYLELHRDVNRVARALLRRGVQKGDFVALLFKNSIDFFRVYFACARIGAAVLPLNPNLTLADYRHICGEAKPKLLVAHGDLLATALKVNDEVDSVETVIVARGASGRPELPASAAGIVSLDDFVSGAQASDDVYLDDVEVLVENGDTVQCIYTSGTTATPKGVLTSHLAALFAAISVAHHQRITASDTALVLFPNHHVAGLNDSVIPYLMAGATTVLLDGWNAELVAKLLEEHRVTMTILTGPMMVELFERNNAGQYDWSSMRLFILGISSLPEERAARVRAVCPNADLLLASGQTEFTGYEEGVRPEDQRSKPGAWGNPTLMTDVAIMDEFGKIQPPNVVGEIVYRGPQAMTAYLGQPEQTAESFQGGWFHSGDLGYVDEDHTVYFVDRKKDMIKTGGENVASIEVAQVIMSHEAVAECTVVGLPHPRWTEAITAFVKPREDADVDEETVLAHCRARLAAFKVPKRVIFLDEFPRTASRKIRNVELRQQYGSLYG